MHSEDPYSHHTTHKLQTPKWRAVGDWKTPLLFLSEMKKCAVPSSSLLHEPTKNRSESNMATWSAQKQSSTRPTTFLRAHATPNGQRLTSRPEDLGRKKCLSSGMQQQWGGCDPKIVRAFWSHSNKNKRTGLWTVEIENGSWKSNPIALPPQGLCTYSCPARRSEEDFRSKILSLGLFP